MDKTKRDKRFGLKVQEWRKHMDLTQLEASEVIAAAARRPVSFQLYQKIEYGTNMPQEWFVIAFANVSGQHVNTLLKLAGLTQIEKAALQLA
jgi:transcriptional regulator with XRE-family HTH domain